MNLLKILYGIKYKTNLDEKALQTINPTSINIDSRKVLENSIFVAIKGLNVDGHKFIDKAIEKKASVVIVMEEPKDKNIPYILVEDTRKTLGLICSNFYNNPSKNMTVIGITGTNGKTSTAYFLEEILIDLGIKTGLIGTLGIKINGEDTDFSFDTSTMPDAHDLQKALYLMKEKNVEVVVMEVTSQGLDQDRHIGIDFNTAVLTNITQDHLDYHGNMENYVNSKLKLFENSKKAVINIDADFKDEFIKKSNNIISYSIENDSDLCPMEIEYKKDRVCFTLMIDGKLEKVTVNIPGKFTVYNILATIGTLISLNKPIGEFVELIKNIKNVPGRIENVAKGHNFNLFIDYAHSPDGLLNITKSVREFTKGRVITVFGCGGDRDRTKRPIMGKVAGENSDFCIITSDNPRSENPNTIVSEVEVGVKETKCMYEVVVDRKEAIYRAVQLADDKDSLIIAGKGHEDYQIFKDRTIHFDDREISLSALEDIYGKN